jgi:hypothetical protein
MTHPPTRSEQMEEEARARQEEELESLRLIYSDEFVKVCVCASWLGLGLELGLFYIYVHSMSTVMLANHTGARRRGRGGRREGGGGEAG